LRVSVEANGIGIERNGFYIPTALLARRDAIAGDESGGAEGSRDGG